MEPAENSEPILLPYLGSGTELHCVSLVRGTAGEEAAESHRVRAECNRRERRGPVALAVYVAEDGLVGHQGEEWPLVLWAFNASM